MIPKNRAIYLVYLCLALCRSTSAQAQDVRVPVKYDNIMLVVVSKQGVAAIKFEKPFEIGNETRNGITGISYRWRYLENSEAAEEETGSERVFVKLNDGQVEDRKCDMVCGPLKLKWNYVELGAGFVGYNADEMQVFSFTPSLFESKIVPGFEETAIDLRVFQKSTANIEQVRKRLASPVVYKGCTLIVRTSEGTARVTFGEAYTKEISATEKRYGVPCHAAFVSKDGQTKTESDDEVYERYTKGAYDQGKLEISSGPIHFQWSRGGDDLGWIYYEIENTTAWNVDSNSADVLLKSLE